MAQSVFLRSACSSTAWPTKHLKDLSRKVWSSTTFAEIPFASTLHTSKRLLPWRTNCGARRIQKWHARMDTPSMKRTPGGAETSANVEHALESAGASSIGGIANAFAAERGVVWHWEAAA